MKDRSFDIARLFAGFLADNLTEEQQQVLEAWKSASPENLALFDKVCREKIFGNSTGWRSNTIEPGRGRR